MKYKIVVEIDCSRQTSVSLNWFFMPIVLRPGYFQAKNRRKPDLNWKLETGNLKPLLCEVPMQSGRKQTLVVTGNLGRTETGNWKLEI